MANLGKVVYLSDEQAQTLFANNTITVDGTTINYNENDLYVTPSQVDSVYVNGNLAYVTTMTGLNQVSIVTPSSGTSFSLAPYPVTYSFGEMATLTVTVSATTQYHFMFSCPSAAATTLTINGITSTAGDTIAANKTYEVSIWNGIAFIKEIVLTPVGS